MCAGAVFNPVRAQDDALQPHRDQHNDTLWRPDGDGVRVECYRENCKPVVEGLARVCREHGLNPLPLAPDLGPPPPPDNGDDDHGPGSKRRRPLSMD